MLRDGDETERINAERARLEEKLKRLCQAWIEVEIHETYYRQQKAETESRLASLVIPNGFIDLEEAAELLNDMSAAWEAGSREERRAMLGLMFEAIYCDPAEKSLVAIRPYGSLLPLLREIDLLQEEGTKFILAQCK